MEALLAGLELPGPPGGALGPAQWQLVGALLRTMTSGLLDLLTARMVAKREFGAEGTQLRSRENNPLKFSPDVDTALAHLLGPAERGFLPPVQAAREAFDDLRAHQLALLAGMRAALDAVMSRFDPAAFEQRAAPGGTLESLIPSQRKARLWDAYSQQFAQIVGEVEGDFDTLLARAFLKAYRAQLAELAGGRGEPGRPG
jgi:FHA domain-containing protein